MAERGELAVRGDSRGGSRGARACAKPRGAAGYGEEDEGELHAEWTRRTRAQSTPGASKRMATKGTGAHSAFLHGQGCPTRSPSHTDHFGTIDWSRGCTG